MATLTLKGNVIHTVGDLPAIGSQLKDFQLTKTDLADVSIQNYKGSKLVINIFPSIDTPVCAMSVRKFNAEAANLPNTKVLCVSKDLPFAHARFCGAEGINNVDSTSILRDVNFGRNYGIEIIDGPLAGLMGRAVVIADENGTVIYTELIPEIGQEPNYEAALNSLK